MNMDDRESAVREAPTRHGYVHFCSDPGPASAPLLHRGLAHGPVRGLLDFLLWLGETQRPGWEERVGELLAVISQVLTAGPLPEPARPEPAALTAALDYVRRQWGAAMRPLARRRRRGRRHPAMVRNRRPPSGPAFASPIDIR